MFKRFKINRCLKKLITKRVWSENDAETMASKYPNEINALSAMGCIKVGRNLNGDVLLIKVKDRAYLYFVLRSDLWVERIFVFFSGLVTGALVALIK